MDKTEKKKRAENIKIVLTKYLICKHVARLQELLVCLSYVYGRRLCVQNENKCIYNSEIKQMHLHSLKHARAEVFLRDKL